MTRKRVLLVILTVLLLAGVGLLVVRLLARDKSSARADGRTPIDASSDASAVKRGRAGGRPVRHLVSPRAEAERAPGASSISGRVVDDMSGRGVPNATLSFLRGGTSFGADTDEAGAFVLDGLEPGLYELYTITAPGYAPFEADNGLGAPTLRVDAKTRLLDVTFSLRALFYPEGTVVDPAGAPVAGAQVRLVDGDADETTTDADGHFAIACSLGAVLEARHERFAPGRAGCDRSARLGRPMTLRLAAAAPPVAPGSISGRVVGVDDRGIEGAVVSAERLGVPRSMALAKEAVSGADGRFLLEALEAGAYDVGAASAGLAKTVASGVRTGEANLVLRLVAGGVLRGLVRERASGKPNAGFSIVLWPMRGLFERGPPLVRTFFDPDGRFEISELRPGDYTVTALSAGWPSAEERRASVVAGRAADVLLELVAGGRVHGKVQDKKTGSPIAGAEVGLESSIGDEPSAVPLLTAAITDDRGAFELKGVGSGRFSLAVSAAGHHHMLLSGLELRAGAELGPLLVDLDPTAPGEDPKFELFGIGAGLRPQGDAIFVTGVTPDGGAARAGLTPGDRILAVDGIPVAGLGFKGTLEQIRGTEGTAVRLHVGRGQGELDLIAVRGRVRR